MGLKMAGGVAKFLQLTLAAAILGLSGPAMAQTVKLGKSGLPVPRFVSLKSDAVNVRRGPSREHDVVWRYVRRDLPVEITQEFENWRRIRDVEGAEGWVFHSLLSSKRTALVMPWEKTKTPVPVYREESEASGLAAKLEPNVQTIVDRCDGTWCKVEGKGFEGWIAQTALWGVYPGETFE